MGRPPLAVGTYGKIKITPSDGGHRARASFRDLDGKRREVSRWAATKGGAERALKAAFLDRVGGDSTGDVNPDMRLSALAERWLADVEAAELAIGTKQKYRYIVDNYVLPGLGALRLREATVPRIDGSLRAVRIDRGPGAAKSARAALSGMLAIAVRNGALPSNPVRDTTPIAAKSKTVRALTIDETNQLIDNFRASERAVEMDIPDLVDWMLGTGMRIGEACAVRTDVLDRDARTVEVNATIVREKGTGLLIQLRPKTAAGWRVLALPDYLTEMLTRRRGELRLTGPDGVVFASPRGHLRDPSNTSGVLRELLDMMDCETCNGSGWIVGEDAKRTPCTDVGPWAWITSHTFRKTVATRLDEAGLSARQIADQLGHAAPSMTTDKYMGRKVVSAEAAKVLDRR